MDTEPDKIEVTQPNRNIKSIDGFEPAIKPIPIETIQPKEEKKSFGEPIKEVVDKPKPKSNKLLKVLLVLLLVLIVSASAAGATYWWSNKNADEIQNKQASDISTLKKENANLKKQLALAETENKLTTNNQTTCTAVAPTAAEIESIKASITSGNTAALSGYMAPSVNVILAATEGVGPSTPAIAVSTISTFISNDNKSWDYNFALPAATLKTYSNGGYKEYFPDSAVVGKASNGKIIAFSFDCNGKISTVFMAVSAELL